MRRRLIKERVLQGLVGVAHPASFFPSAIIISTHPLLWLPATYRVLGDEAVGRGAAHCCCCALRQQQAGPSWRVRERQRSSDSSWWKHQRPGSADSAAGSMGEHARWESVMERSGRLFRYLAPCPTSIVAHATCSRAPPGALTAVLLGVHICAASRVLQGHATLGELPPV